MALTVNTKIINDVDNYSLDAKQVKGGYGVVNTVSDLSSLPPATIVKGSLYYVQAVDKFYKYNGSAWEEAQFGGGNVDDVKVDGTSVVTDKVANINLSKFSITATASELNTLDGITATTSELNMLSGTTEYTAAEVDTLWESI